MASPRIIVAAGGTGGHLWPAVSLARAVQRLEPASEFLFVGTGRPVEARILEPAGFDRVVLESSGVKGRSLGGQIKALGQCALALGRSLKIVDKFRPNLYFGAGGYVPVPVGLAARIKGVPLTLHEQNSRPGLSNKVLARLAKKVFLGFEDAAGAFPAGKTVFTGNPVRPEIAALHERTRQFGGRAAKVLVTGGSQGARTLNHTVAPGLASLHHRSGADFSIIHQTGPEDCQWVEQIYREAGVEATVAEFFQDMAALYDQADLVISRAGALTLAELTAAKLPSILSPLSTAADDHQTVNARSLVNAGAALMATTNDISAELIEDWVGGLLNDPGRLEKMSEAAGRQARLSADEDMARACLKLIEGN